MGWTPYHKQNFTLVIKYVTLAVSFIIFSICKNPVCFGVRSNILSDLCVSDNRPQAVRIVYGASILCF